MLQSSIRLFLLCPFLLVGFGASAANEAGQNPRYNQILVIIAKNRAYDDIISKPYAPHKRAAVCAAAPERGLAHGRAGLNPGPQVRRGKLVLRPETRIRP